MRTILLATLLLPAFALAAPKAKPNAKDDLAFSQKSRSFRDESGHVHASVTIKHRSERGLTTTAIERPGRYGVQETSWTRTAEGSLVRKTVAGTRLINDRPNRYFVAEGDSKTPLTDAQLTRVTHTAQQPSERAGQAARREPALWGKPRADLRFGWSSGPYRAIAEKFGLEIATHVHADDAAALAAFKP
jgi:hypothetical protein